MTIRRRTLVACLPFATRLPAPRAGAALAQGLRAGGAPPPDVLALEDPPAGAQEIQTRLAAERFDARMLACRALVLAVGRLDEQALAGSLTLELATRARQSGVPCYAVARRGALGAFDARMLDLQVVLDARDERGLERAGRGLAAIV